MKNSPNVWSSLPWNSPHATVLKACSLQHTVMHSVPFCGLFVRIQPGSGLATSRTWLQSAVRDVTLAWRLYTSLYVSNLQSHDILWLIDSHKVPTAASVAALFIASPFKSYCPQCVEQFKSFQVMLVSKPRNKTTTALNSKWVIQNLTHMNPYQ